MNNFFLEKLPQKMVQITTSLAVLLVSVSMGLNAQSVHIGTGGTNTDYAATTIPVQSLSYGYSQQIVTAAEFSAGGGQAGNIAKIRWMFPNIGSDTSVYGDWDVWIGHTTKTDFTSNTDYVDVSTLTKIFSGNIHNLPIPPANNTWFEINFSNTIAFNYDGVSNLVIAVYEKTPGATSNGLTIRTYNSAPDQGIVLRSNNGVNPSNPQISVRTNLLPQLQFEMGTAPVCSAPTGLSATQTSSTSANLSWTEIGSNIDSYDVEWGQNGFGLGSGTQINGITTNSTSVTTVMSADYEFYVRQNCSGSDGSSSWAGPFKFRTGHCVPSFAMGITGINGIITNFSTTNAIVDIDNPTNGQSLPNGYGDFTATHELQILKGTSFNVTAGTNTSAGASMAIWIDWNNNGVFETTERVFTATGVKNTAPANGTISVASSQPDGFYRMRIISIWGANTPVPSNPCVQTIESGEAEDYTIIVVSTPPTCPPVTNISKNNETISSVDISWLAGGSETSWEIQWGTNLFNPISNTGTLVGSETVNGTPEYTITDLVVDTNYQIFIRANCTGETSFWRSTTYTPNYCDATSLWDWSGITSFFTTGGVENISNMFTGVSPNGYNNFTNMVVSSIMDGSIDFELHSTETDGTAIGIWVDWNNDGIFEDTEKVYASPDYINSATGTITVPAGQLLGDYRLRVRTDFVGVEISPGDVVVLPCGEIVFGETEDYTFRVVSESNTCSPVTALNTSNATTTSINVSWTAGGTETLWNVEYGITGFTQGTGITTVAVAPSILINGLTPGTSYDIYIQSNCGSGNQSTWEMTNFSTIDDGYCVPSYSLDSDFTTAFSTTVNGTININYTATSQTGIDGYNDLSGDSSYNTTLATGETVNFSHSYEGEFGITDHTLRIWVDWNNNEIFEDSEEVFNQYSVDATQTGSFDVPSNQAIGNYRMRIRTRYDNNTIDACLEYGYGQALDFTIVVVCPTIATPTGEANQTFEAGQTIADLDVTGDNLVWYSDSTYSETLSLTDVLVDQAIYYVRSEIGGCVSDPLIITVTQTVNISNFDLYSFSYYPNPVNDVLHFSSNQLIENVVITNMLGQQINANLSSDKTSLDLSNLSSGNYFVKVTIEGVSKTFKVVKK